jgi:hypothetical protein
MEPRASLNGRTELQNLGMTVLFWIGIAFTALVPITIGLTGGSASTTWVAALCGAFITFMAKLKDLTELSLGPVRAKMRETIAEANATVEQLREVATTLVSAMLTDMMAGNFMSGMTLGVRLELRDQVMSSLRRIGVSEDQLSRAEAEWRKGIGVTYHRIVAKAIQRAAGDGKHDPALATEFQELLDFPTWSAPRPVEMESFARKRGVLTEDVQGWIADYRHFLDTNEIRRRGEFERE